MKSFSVLIVVGMLALTGCSTFKKEWRTAAAAPASPIPSIEGAWEGEWRSEKNGHHGSLQCVVKRMSHSLYRAHFRAKYMKVLRFSYEATLSGWEQNGVVTLRGETDLGKLAGGVYTYEGTVTPQNFQSTYRCKMDHGRYEMKRPAP